MRGRLLLSVLIAFSLVFAGCATTNQPNLSAGADRLLALAEQNGDFRQAVQVFEASGLALLTDSAVASIGDEGSVLGVVSGDHSHVISVYFDTSKRIETVIVARLDDGSGNSLVANLSTGRLAQMGTNDQGEPTAVQLGNVGDASTLESLMVLQPTLHPQCSACQRALEDLEAAERNANGAWAVVAGVQLAVLVACTIPGPPCLAALAALAAAYLVANNASAEVGRMSGYYDDCYGQNC